MLAKFFTDLELKFPGSNRKIYLQYQQFIGCMYTIDNNYIKKQTGIHRVATNYKGEIKIMESFYFDVKLTEEMCSCRQSFVIFGARFNLITVGLLDFSLHRSHLNRICAWNAVAMDASRIFPQQQEFYNGVRLFSLIAISSHDLSITLNILT